MASSSKCTLIALLVAFVVVAASQLHACAATRDGGAAKAAAAPAPSANGEVLHPTGLFDDFDLPLPRILPCPPVFPKIPLIPCYKAKPSPSPPPPQKECRSTLVKSMPPCAGFLTNSSVSSPPKECCNGIHPFFSDLSVTPFCLCHVMNGDADQILPAPVIHTRALTLLQACSFNLSPNMVSSFCKYESYRVPPMDLPSPPAPGDRA